MLMLGTIHAQWITVPTGTLDELESVLVDGPDAFMTGGMDGRLMRTTNGGATWDTQFLTAAGGIGDILRLDADLILLAGEGGVVMRTTNDGATWTAVSTPAPDDLYAMTRWGNTIWASGRDGAIVRSNDLGLTWAAQSTGTAERIHGIHALSADRVVAVGREGVLLRTVNGGVSWMLSTIAGGEDLRGLCFLDDPQQTGLAAGPEGFILRSTDLGDTWTPVSIGALNSAQAIASFSPGVAYAVGNSALVLRSTDQGASWEPMTTLAFSELSAVDVRSGMAVAVGANGTMIKLNEGGPSGIAEHLAPGALSVYPNPSNGTVSVGLPAAHWAGGNDPLRVEILFSDGRLLRQLVWAPGAGELIIDTLPPGHYMIRAADGQGVTHLARLVVTG